MPMARQPSVTFRSPERSLMRAALTPSMVFLVSHQIGSIRDTCERTIWLESGVIRMDGTTDEVVPEYEIA